MVSCEGLGNGGVQAVMMNIVRQLHGTYHFDMLLFTSERRHYDNEFENYGTIYRIPNYEGPNSLRRRLDYYVKDNRIYNGVKKILINNGPFDVIHCNSEFESAMCVKAAHECRVPVRIIHTHTVYHSGNIVEKILDNHRLGIMIKDSTDRIGCTDEACKSFYGNKASYKVVPNPYDSKRFNPKKYQSDDDHLVLTQIGSYNSNKNQIFTIQVFAEICKLIKDAKLNFIGFGSKDEINKLLQEAKKFNVSENVSFLPNDADAPLLLSKTTAYIFPSHHEGFGLTLIEAQAMGVHCYVSDTVPRMTDVGGCEYLPISLGAKKWADKIIQDFMNGVCRHTNYDCTKFSSENVAKSIARIYEGENGRI